MPNCPQCNTLIDVEAIRCPHCFAVLKAYGHPGIPLYQAPQATFLCDSCLYHEDDSCNYPQRPQAKTCTMYCDRDRPPPGSENPTLYQSPAGLVSFKLWCLRHRGVLIVLAIVLVSLWMTLS